MTHGKNNAKKKGKKVETSSAKESMVEIASSARDAERNSKLQSSREGPPSQPPPCVVLNWCYIFRSQWVQRRFSGPTGLPVVSCFFISFFVCGCGFFFYRFAHLC
jgi:hypothetical protein